MVGRDAWAYVAFVAMATLCRGISCSSAGQFENLCRASLKELAIMVEKKTVTEQNWKSFTIFQKINLESRK
jgi:hypothetical protein